MKKAMLALVALAVSGCGLSETHVTQITGVVNVDGRPGSFLTVTFWPAENLALGHFKGHTDGQGRFCIHVNPKKCPAQPGHYKVKVALPMLPVGMMDQLPVEKRDALLKAPRVPAEYGDAASTPLAVDLRPGLNDVAFEIAPGKEKRSEQLSKDANVD